MAKLGTFCNKCCFYDAHKRDCLLGCHSLFKDREAEFVWEDDGGPSIDRVCPYRRKKEWEFSRTIEERMELATREVYVKGTILLHVKSLDDLIKTLDKISTIPRIENFKIIVSHSSSIKTCDMKELCEKRITFTQYCCVRHCDNSEEMQIYHSLKEARNGYVIILDCSKDFDTNCIDKLNHFLYKKLFRLLHVNGVAGSTHQSITMVSIYRFLKGDIQCSIGEKLKDIAEYENSDPQITNWEKIDEEYNN